MAHRAHLDYASTAPLRDSAKQAMVEAANTEIYDPRRLYDDAIKSRYDIESSREKIADFFGCEPFEVIFTSSHSESLGSFAYGVLNDESSNVVISPYESDVLFKFFEREKCELRVFEGNNQATINTNDIHKLIDKKTAGVSVVFAHPDTGTLQNISEINDIVKSINTKTIFHVDARSACGNTKLNFSDLDIDAMSVDPVTFGGPSGIAALIVSRKCHLKPLLIGSTQERARRSGLENHIGIAGFGATCESAKITLVNEITQNRLFTKQIWEELNKRNARFIDYDLDNIRTISNTVSAYFEGIAASAVVANFNRNRINIHAGSACGSEEFEPSKQLMPVTNDETISESIFRISVGYATTQNDINLFIEALDTLY